MQCNHETLWTRRARTRRSHCHRYDTLTFDNISAMAAKKWTKKCAALSEFLFCLLSLLHFRFSRFRRRRRKSSSFLVAQARKTILDMRRFCWKNRPFDEKCATEKTSTVTNKEAPIILNVKTTHSFKTNDHFRTVRPCFSCKATKQKKDFFSETGYWCSLFEAGFGVLKRNGEIRTRFGTENMHDMWDAKNNHRDRDDGIEEP